MNPASPADSDHPGEAEIPTLGEGEGVKPPGAEPWTDEPAASHDTGAQTRSGARVNKRVATGGEGFSAHSLDRRARGHGQDEQVEEEVVSKAAENWNHGGWMRLDRGKHGMDETGSAGRLVKTSQPQGEVSAPPLQSPSGPTQACDGRRTARLATGAPAKPREGINWGL